MSISEITDGISQLDIKDENIENFKKKRAEKIMRIHIEEYIITKTLKNIKNWQIKRSHYFA